MTRREKWRILSQPKPDIEARDIHIECLEGGKADEEEGYVVCITPKNKQNEPGKQIKNPPYIYSNPIKKVFKTSEEMFEYLKEVV